MNNEIKLLEDVLLKLASLEKIRVSQRLANKKYFEKNKEKIGLQRKEYKKLSNKPRTEEQKEKARNYQKNRYQNDPEFKERTKTRCRNYMQNKHQPELNITV